MRDRQTETETERDATGDRDRERGGWPIECETEAKRETGGGISSE